MNPFEIISKIYDKLDSAISIATILGFFFGLLIAYVTRDYSAMAGYSNTFALGLVYSIPSTVTIYILLWAGSEMWDRISAF
jgi:hypothetical protein